MNSDWDQLIPETQQQAAPRNRAPAAAKPEPHKSHRVLVFGTREQVAATKEFIDAHAHDELVSKYVPRVVSVSQCRAKRRHFIEYDMRRPVRPCRWLPSERIIMRAVRTAFAATYEKCPSRMLFGRNSLGQILCKNFLLEK